MCALSKDVIITFAVMLLNVCHPFGVVGVKVCQIAAMIYEIIQKHRYNKKNAKEAIASEEENKIVGKRDWVRQFEVL